MNEKSATMDGAEQELELLVADILEAEDEERRRMARELHDTTAQHLAAVLISIDHLIASRKDRMMPVVHQARLLVDQSLREIRALCYRLHPPMLPELGLPPALNWLVRGVRQESGLAVSLDVAPNLGRLPQEIETGVFRLIQLELANLGACRGLTRVELTLARPDASIVLSIVASGGSIANIFDCLAGGRAAAGLGSMRARIHQMGGSLRIDSGPGTVHLLICLPVQEERSDPHMELGERA